MLSYDSQWGECFAKLCFSRQANETSFFSKGNDNEDRDPSSDATNTASDSSKTPDHGATPFQANDAVVQPTSSQLNGALPSFSPLSLPSLPPSPPLLHSTTS